MAFYLITRTDATGYDEYDAVVVRASGRKQALKVVTTDDGYGRTMYPGFLPDGSNAQVQALDSIGREAPTAILASYNAG